jgi:hypothetical protein
MTDKEKMKEKWSIMRKIGKKGYVQFRTVRRIHTCSEWAETTL